MKLWIRVLLGAAIGGLLGVIIPIAGGDTAQTLGVVTQIIVNIARYALFPLVLFGVATAIQELAAEGRAGWVILKLVGLVAATTLLLVVVGTVIMLVLSPQRIPPIYQEAIVPPVPTIPGLLAATFPRNLFAVFASDGSFLLPLYALGFILGLILTDESAGGGPIADVCESGSTVFYRLNSLVVDILGIGLTVVVALWLIEVRGVDDLQLFMQLIWVIAGVGAFFVLIVYPVLLFLLAERYSPLAWLFGVMPAAIAAFFSGDGYFAMGTLTRVSKENHGVSRSIAGVTLPLGLLLARAGSAMVTAASFLMVLRSYTALEITGSQVVWLITAAAGISLLLGSSPGAAVLVGLSALAGSFGRGMEEIYLIVIPVLPIITGIAVVVDAATNSFITVLIAHSERHRRLVDPLDFA